LFKWEKSPTEAALIERDAEYFQFAMRLCHGVSGKNQAAIRARLYASNRGREGLKVRRVAGQEISPLTGFGILEQRHERLRAALLRRCTPSRFPYATNSGRNICSQSFSLILGSASACIHATVSKRSPHFVQDQRLITKRSLTNSDQSGATNPSPHLAQVVVMAFSLASSFSPP
jgi:hypothetical protein